MNDNERIAIEIQNTRLEQERAKSAPKKVSDAQVKEARIMWMAGSVLIDLLTSYLIYMLTGYWYYAGIWVLAGAGGLLWSERLKERIGKNKDQRKIADNGVTISGGAVFLMALLVGTVWVMKIASPWMAALMESSALVLFFFHLFQAYQYHQKDDEVIAADEEARLEAQNEKGIREAHRAARLVESKKTKQGYEDEYVRQHGAAYIAAQGKDINAVAVDPAVGFVAKEANVPAPKLDNPS